LRQTGSIEQGHQQVALKGGLLPVGLRLASGGLFGLFYRLGNFGERFQYRLLLRGRKFERLQQFFQRLSGISRGFALSGIVQSVKSLGGALC